MAWQWVLLNNCSGNARPGKVECGRSAGWTSANNNGVVVRLHTYLGKQGQKLAREL
jgi:hypothetical protein